MLYSQQRGAGYGYASSTPAGHDPAMIKRSHGIKRGDKAFVFLAGAFILAMLMIIPVWSGVEMRLDPLFVYYVGPSMPTYLLAFCGCCFLFYCIVMATFLQRAAPEAHNEQIFYMLAGIFLMLLGTTFVMISYPIYNNSRAAGTSLFLSCNSRGHGVKGMNYQLYATSQVLQALRAGPDCALKPSVEECEGYHQTSASVLLKQMETNLGCSGFCFNLAALNLTKKTLVLSSQNRRAGNSTSKHGTSALQVSADTVEGRQRRQRAVSGQRLQPEGFPRAIATTRAAGQRLAAKAARWRPAATSLVGDAAQDVEESEEAAMLQMGARTSIQYEEEVTVTHEEAAAAYPPTLFSLANYQAACESSSGRHLYAYQKDAGSLLYLEGIFLIGFAVVSSSLKLIGLCSPK